MMRADKKNAIVKALLGLFVLGLFFFLGIVVQKLGYPHRVKEVLFQKGANSQSEIEMQAYDVEQTITPTPVVDQDLMRQSLCVDPARVSLNHERFSDNTKESYRFFVTGHAYGYPDEQAAHPATSWSDFLPLLKEREPAFLFFTGDIVPASTTLDFENFEKEILEGLNIPAFNAVGNHDVENRSLYEQRYGSTYYTFRYGPAQFIVLDTELTACKIQETQKAFLESAVNQALGDPQVNSIFILMHKVLFLGQDSLQILFDSGNVKAAPNAQECYLEHNFDEIISGILLPSADEKPIYVIAGDVGAWCGNLSPFYEKYPDSNMTLLAAGMGDCEEDFILQVAVDQDAVEVSFLDRRGEAVEEFQQYNLAHYRSIAGDEK